MALTDTQLRQLKAKLEPRHVKTRKSDGVELLMWKGGTSLPKPTASSATTGGTGGRCQRAASGAAPAVKSMVPPTRRKCGSACGLEI